MVLNAEEIARRNHNESFTRNHVSESYTRSQDSDTLARSSARSSFISIQNQFLFIFNFSLNVLKMCGVKR